MATPQTIERVLHKAIETASHSWEYSTVFEALLEYHNPDATVFHEPFPNNKIPELDIKLVPALQYVQQYIRTDGDVLCEGNGSSSDPASLGIPALMLSIIFPNAGYFDAVLRQRVQLTMNTPRFPQRKPKSAISHRTAYASCWSDFVYMGPPYMAYFGVVTNDSDLLQEAIQQCERYCELLITDTGIWRHIANAPDVSDVKIDDGAWCTGNAWAAAGMARCLATLRKSRYAVESIADQNSLIKMTADILDGTMEADTHVSGLLRNYLDDESWFGEVAGTALMAATAFRMAVLEPSKFGGKYTGWAVKKMETVWRHIDRETGVVAPVVNSLKEGQRTPLDGVNPEGQAFVVLLFAAWRDWTHATGGGV